MTYSRSMLETSYGILVESVKMPNWEYFLLNIIKPVQKESDIPVKSDMSLYM